MTEFTDLALILFQLVIIIFLKLQIFPFHIGKNPVGKIRRRRILPRLAVIQASIHGQMIHES